MAMLRRATYCRISSKLKYAGVTSYVVFIITAIFVVITACAKSAHLNTVTYKSVSLNFSPSTQTLNAIGDVSESSQQQKQQQSEQQLRDGEHHQIAEDVNGVLMSSTKALNSDTDTVYSMPSKEYFELENSYQQEQQQKQGEQRHPHTHSKQHQQHQQVHHHHHERLHRLSEQSAFKVNKQQHEQQEKHHQMHRSKSTQHITGDGQKSDRFGLNYVFTNGNKKPFVPLDIVTLADVSREVPKRKYRSKYKIEDLLNAKFECQISNDIDMDPCKAGGFMGDIALPNFNYNDYPVVAYTPTDEESEEPQADAPMGEFDNKFNDTLQKEIEILKQEVYHEGLQVEEEGLTDIMRRKTKLPSSTYDLNTDYMQSANELVKPLDSNFNTNYNYLSKNIDKNEVISVENHSTQYGKYPLSDLKKYTECDIITDKGPLNKIYNISGESYTYGNTFNDKISDEVEKFNKTTIGLGNRNVDQRKIQSNTKDIELDTGKNFISERKFVILPTLPPIQRTTLPNVYSNAGGNGMKLDDIQEFKGSSTIVKKRHRRGRKNRHISQSNQKSDYQQKLQQLKEELNRPLESHGPIKYKYKSQSEHYNYFDSHKISPRISAKGFHTFGGSNKNSYGSAHNHSYPQPIYSVPEEDNDDFNFMYEHRRLPRALTAKKERIWDYGVIPYEIDGNFSGLHKALFKQAMRHWENFTCIKFVERDSELHPNYIVFTIRGCGCCSFVGKRGNGPQAISIGRNCDKFGIVVHELGHVVGFWHEHTRPDREKHVVIEPNNIMKGQEYNFNKLTPEEVNSLGMPYDYDSIMHYARNTFSKGTYLDTILPVEMKGKKRPEIGQRLRLSLGDIAQANLLYKCPKCGRTFQDNTGLFESPSFYMIGSVSNETEHCEWRITATHGERVILRLENLNLYKSDNCQTDYLEIRDGYFHKSPLIARYCGKIANEVLTTETSRMLLTYVNKHRSEGFRGFKAEFDVICGGEIMIDDNESRLESPNYPLDYLPNKECVWKITAPKGYQVALKFQSFEVENHDNCVYDFVEVRDGATQDAPLIGVFCGYKPPPNMKSTGDTMYVKFVSDTSVQKPGFSANFMKEVDECETRNHGCAHECINTLGGYECACHIGFELHSDKKHCEDACGGVIEYPNGTITSPSFPDKYPMLKDCIWEIIAPPKHKISLNFTHFDLEGAAHHQSECGYDKVAIYSKLSESRLKRIGTYCGSSIPPIATSEGNALRIEFHSDKSIQTSGFAAVFFTDVDECSINNGGCQHECRNTIGSYVCSCHNGYSLHENAHDCKEGECKHEISSPFGTIYSPNHPDLYPPNADCVWHFSTTPGHRIKLIFNEFKLESHQECSYDNMIIYDGDSENSSMLGRFCGDKIPYPISSSTNQLYMVLKTDKNKQHSGFTAVHSTSCGGYLRATPQIQQFYSHSRYGNHDYDINMDCEWLIQAPMSSNVQLIFLTFDLETSENCTYDYVQVFSGMEDTSGPMYGQFCGNALPQDIISITDSLLVRFKTDSSITMKGFSASYVAVDPFEISEEDEDEDPLLYSSEMVTPFPGSLKSIYKEEDNSQETDDYNDFNENRLVINSSPYYMNRYLMTFG